MSETELWLAKTDREGVEIVISGSRGEAGYVREVHYNVDGSATDASRRTYAEEVARALHVSAKPISEAGES
ncbi:MAG TPA: hypothetical protein VG253_21165 [Streptosporangiaceae bacterium]|nr:hypothetical protein [Streptosporangiaceae bacterium]